jgi:phosphate ABC transporter permease protein PstC
MNRQSPSIDYLKNRLKHIKSQPIEMVLFICASFSIVMLFMMLIFVLKEGAEAFFKFGTQMLFGQYWNTTAESFGGFPLLYASFMVTVGALVIALPVGLGTAVFISEILPYSIRDPVKSVIELLASIPSVIYGFIGLLFLAPLVSNWFDIPSGKVALTASIILSLMTIPTIVSVSSEILSSVPKDYKDGSLALGATKWQTIRGIVLPVATPGMFASIMLGFGRAIGETVAVLMVAGNVAMVPSPPWNYLRSVFTIPSVIAMQMGEAAVGSLEYSSLFGLGLILFVITFIVNTLADIVVRRATVKGGLKL